MLFQTTHRRQSSCAVGAGPWPCASPGRFCLGACRARNRARGHGHCAELLVHIAAGNLPTAALLIIVLGVLARSAQFVKCAGGSSLLPRLFAHSLYEAEPKLGACLEIAEWRGAPALERPCSPKPTASPRPVATRRSPAIRQRLPARARFLGYGHRVSFGFIANGVLSGLHARRVAARAAADIAAWNQLGCLSPHA